MAFGSATVRPSKTMTKARSSGHTRDREEPVASTSAGRRRKLVPSESLSPPSSPKRRRPSDSSSSDSDFGADMRNEAKKDKRVSREKNDAARRREERKAFKERGETPPPELLKPPSKRAKTTPTKKIKPDEQAVMDNVRKEALKRKGKRREVEPSTGSDEDDARPTYPSLNLVARKKEVEKRTGYRVVSGAPDSDDANSDDFDEKEVARHLKRRWVNKEHPERMTARQKELELKFNPLVQLLNIRLVVVEGGGEPDDSDSDVAVRRGKAAVKLDTDTDDTDWNTDGMGEYNGMLDKSPSPAPPARAKVKLENSGDEDVKPTITPQGSPSAPHIKQEGHKIDVMVLDDEDEPSTEEEDGDSASQARTAHARPAPTSAPFAHAVKRETSIGDVKVEPPVDSGDEPDTEGSDVEIEKHPAALRPHFSAHGHGHGAASSSQPTASSQLFSSIKGESQSQLSQHYSQTASQRLSQKAAARVKQEPMDVDVKAEEEDDDDGDESDGVMYDIGGASRRQQENDEKRRRAQRQAEIQEQLADARRRKALEDSVKVPSGEEEEEKDAVDEDEPVAWKLRASQPVDTGYPRPVTKGRPKFMLTDAKQAKTGPHLLSRDPGDKAQIPAPINKFLRPYQREGVEFLYGQYQKGLGGILGDDMGLGKTIQVIAFLSAVMGKTGFKKYDADKRKNASNLDAKDLGKTCLIVCPASVVHNWEREFKTWGYFDVGIYGGDKRSKEACLKRFDKGYLDVIIGSIDAIRISSDEISKRAFDIVIVDEAHKVKNPKSATTHALHQFNTPFRYGLTGTAIQNRLSEFWCILNWAVPGKVGTLNQWEDLVSHPIKHAQKADATDDELVLGRTRAQALVTNLLPNFWLRRTKESVRLQLPKKTDNIVLCPLTDLQKSVYSKLLELDDVQIMLTADDPCPCGERDPNGDFYRRGSCCEQEWPKLIFKYIMLFQKVSNHLALIYPDKEDKEKNADKYLQDLEWVRAAFPEDYDRRKLGGMSYLDPDLCGKWKILCELLQVWYEQGDKVLIFSMSLKIIDLLKDLMETTRYQYLTLDGSTPQEDRMPLVDQFEDPDQEYFCFLISTKAGGVGLNLTAANRVVIFDPNWNPSHDLQAMDRAYRFGQTREVNVYRLIGAGTLEELIYNRQQSKRALASTAYDATAERRLYRGVEKGGKDQAGDLWGVKNIFKFNAKNSLTQKAIHEANLAELEYALRNTSMLEATDGKVAELHEPDEDEIVAEVTGYSNKAKATQNMTVEELDAHQRHLEEQEKISRILGSTMSVTSDATLGGSRVEAERGRRVVQAAMHNKGKKPARPSAAAAPSPAEDTKPSKKRPFASSSKAGDSAPREWNPLERKKKKVHPANVAALDAYSQTTSARAAANGNLFTAFDVPAAVSGEEILAAAGYGGQRGVQRFHEELEGAVGEKGRAALLRRIAGAWKKANP
ncbi:hypothetical protein JCM10207_002640 [Rhodosporidiobolus poonsookiae]